MTPHISQLTQHLNERTEEIRHLGDRSVFYDC